MHARSPILAVTVDPAGDEVDVTVVDQGRGIPPRSPSPSWSGAPTGQSSTGQGIGLNVAQRLVTGMDGRLQIDSTGRLGHPRDGHPAGRRR